MKAVKSAVSFLAAVLAVLTVPRESLVNRDWHFYRGEEIRRSESDELVSLPHSARLADDTESTFNSFQGVVWYRKKFQPTSDWSGKRVVLRFEGAMQKADVYVNGELRLHHTGGYLPFEVNLTQESTSIKPFEVSVRVDNRDDASFPPGRPQSALDFTYAGGLYRNVWLEITSITHISNVYAYSNNVSTEAVDIIVKAEIEADSRSDAVTFEVIDDRSRVVETKTVTKDQFLKSTGNSSSTSIVNASISIVRPKLWDLEHPNLYRVRTRINQHGKVADETTTRMGIRHVEFDHNRGLFLNGNPLRLEGSNRHMAFPVVGNAASDNAQFREAKLLKSLGLNVLRLAHYPQSPAFLDACDELGILVIDPIPGWQYFKNTDEFKQHVLRDVRETVVRDRNHPCVAIFETCLNETYSPTDAFWISCSTVAKQTFGEGNFFTGGDAYGKKEYSRPIWDVPWTGWDDRNFTRPALFAGQMGIDREYGDYEFGGEESTSRVDRSGGEGALLLQAWNFIWSHNRNRGNRWSFGDLTWEAIDTHRGMNPSSPVSKSGMLDLYRLPKPIAYFFQSQGLQTPVVHIANNWSARPSPTKVVVFSNCDEIELRLNGKSIARQHPDHGPTTGYIGPKVADPLYWAHGKGEIIPATQIETPIGGNPGALPFTGGNCQNLSHPPFTFDSVAYSPGHLEAIGYRKGRVIAVDSIFTPSVATHLTLRIETQGRPLKADGSDFVFAYVQIRDANNQIVPQESATVSLQVRGPARVIFTNHRKAVAGIAPFLIQSTGRAGTVEVIAVANDTMTTKTTLTVNH